MRSKIFFGVVFSLALAFVLPHLGLAEDTVATQLATDTNTVSSDWAKLFIGALQALVALVVVNLPLVGYFVAQRYYSNQARQGEDPLKKVLFASIGMLGGALFAVVAYALMNKTTALQPFAQSIVQFWTNGDTKALNTALSGLAGTIEKFLGIILTVAKTASYVGFFAVLYLLFKDALEFVNDRMAGQDNPLREWLMRAGAMGFAVILLIIVFGILSTTGFSITDVLNKLGNGDTSALTAFSF